MNQLSTFLKSRSYAAIFARITFYLAWIIFFIILPERPENYIILSVVMLGFGSYLVFKRLKNNREYSREKFLRLRHEKDDMEKMLSLSVGVIMLIGVIWYVIAAGHFAPGTMLSSLIGMFLLFNGITFQNSVVLKKEAGKIVHLGDPEYQIAQSDIGNLSVFLNQIIVEIESEKSSVQINHLQLKQEDMADIRNWFATRN